MTTERYHAGSATDSLTDPLFVTGEKQIVHANVVVESGAGVVAQYSVLGLKTTGGKAILSLSAATDGTEVPKYILAYEVDATSADVTAAVYAEGCFNPDMLVIGTAHTAASITEGLRDLGIYLKAPA